MTNAVESNGATDLECLKKALEEVGIEAVCREEGDRYSYLIFGTPPALAMSARGLTVETAPLDDLLTSDISFVEFENGKLMSY